MADGSLIFDTKIDSKGFKDGLGKLEVLPIPHKGVGKVVAAQYAVATWIVLHR